MSVTLLERDQPLAALRFAFERSKEERRLLLLGGEAGVGKSALVGAFLAEVAGEAGGRQTIFARPPRGRRRPVSACRTTWPGSVAT